MSTKPEKRRRYPQGVSEFRDRHGKVRVRYRAKGMTKPYYFKAKFGTEEWRAEYRCCVAGDPVPPRPREKAASGSVAELIDLFLASPRWASVGDAYRRGQAPRFALVRRNMGHLAVADVTYAEAQRAIVGLASKPSKAERVRRLMAQVWREGMRHGIATSNPWALVDPVTWKSDGRLPWSREEVAQYEARWPIGTRERLAMALLRYTTQRGGDVRRLGPANLSEDGRTIEVRQSKTGALVRVPVHPELRAALDSTPLGKETWLVNARGGSMSEKVWDHFFRRAVRAAGLPDRCRAHGIRKSTLGWLAEAGATNEQLKAWGGHKTDHELAVYTVGANRLRMATDVMGALG